MVSKPQTLGTLRKIPWPSFLNLKRKPTVALTTVFKTHILPVRQGWHWGWIVRCRFAVCISCRRANLHAGDWVERRDQIVVALFWGVVGPKVPDIYSLSELGHPGMCAARTPVYQADGHIGTPSGGRNAGDSTGFLISLGWTLQAFPLIAPLIFCAPFGICRMTCF